MDLLKKKSFTLVELAITMVLGGILILTLAVQFVAMVRLGDVLKNKAEPSREAYIVMAHMTNVMRFAGPSTISFTSDDNGELLAATIEGGHIPLISGNTACHYRRDKTTNCLYFLGPAGVEEILSEYVTYFYAGWGNENDKDPIKNEAKARRELTLKLTFTRNGSSLPDETKIKVLAQ